MITAKGKFRDHEIEAEVVNPGDWFGKTWLIEIGGGFEPLWLAVEAGSVSDAIDELADSEKHGHHIRVADADLGDYDEDDCSRAGNDGAVVDLDHLAVHGEEGSAAPWPCTYHGDDLPPEGVNALIYNDFTQWLSEDPRK